MAKQDELRLLIKIATLYYSEGLKQANIAKMLNLSQSQVSRALSRSLKKDLVKISVVQPPNIFVGLEQELQSRYGIKQCIVVDIPDNASKEQINRAIGSSAAHYMETTLIRDALVGISSWSEAVQAMINNMHPVTTKASGVIQLLGGVGQNGNLHANMMTQSLAQMLGCPVYLLPAINIERSVEDKRRLKESIEVSEVVAKFKDVDLAIVGIGSTEPSAMLRHSGNYYQKEMTHELISRGAVGDICLHYFNSDGEPVLSEDEDPVISMTLQELSECPRVVALAGGRGKVQAIKGALRGKLLDTLITDRITARLLLAEEENPVSQHAVETI